MAICPRCKGAMGATEIICPHCGYDFPEQPASRFNSFGLVRDASEKRGIAYSELAGCALTIGMVLTGVGAILSLVAGVVFLMTRHYAQALIQAPFSFFMSLALFIVFRRVADMD